jgi:hypothetical protein
MKVVREGLLSFISQVIDAFEQLVVTRGGDGEFTSSIRVENKGFHESFPDYFLRITKPDGKIVYVRFRSGVWIHDHQIVAKVFCYEKPHDQKDVHSIFTYKIEEGQAAANNIALAIAYRSW